MQTLGSGFASSSPGKGLKALGAGGTLGCFLLCVWDRVCPVRDCDSTRKTWKEGRKAGRVRAEEHPVASRRSQTQ